VTLHLIKLCVGVESVEELAPMASRTSKELKKKAPLVLMHVTRMTPNAPTNCSTAARFIGSSKAMSPCAKTAGAQAGAKTARPLRLVYEPNLCRYCASIAVSRLGAT